MKLRSLASRLLPLVLAGASCLAARADTLLTGNFSADNSTYTYLFSNPNTTSYTFSTTSFANGGFLPVLTLFNVATGAPVDYTNSGYGDVSITDLLGSGKYELLLSEYPNVAIGNLMDALLFAGDTAATGNACGGSRTGQQFINATTCSAVPLGTNYAVNVASSPAVTATPEPSSLLLMLVPAAGLFAMVRRRFTPAGFAA